MNKKNRRAANLRALRDAGLTAAACVLFITEYVLLSRITLYSAAPAAGALLIVVMLAQSISTTTRCVGFAVVCAVTYGVMIGIFAQPYARADRLGVILVMLFLFGGGLLSGILRQRMNEQKRQNERERAQRRQINELNAQLIATTSMEALQKLILQSVYTTCGHSAVYYIPCENTPVRVASYPAGLIVYRRELDAVRQAFESGRIIGVGTDFCTSSAFRSYPIRLGGRVEAVVAVLFGVNGGTETANLALVDQLIQRSLVALERQALIDEQQRIITEKQVEQMRADFLRAISHDLRSPLAAIMGACSALERVTDTESNSGNLVADIREESEWLLHMVENLLSVTRVGTGSPKLSLSSEAVEEIVGEAAYKCRTRFSGLKLHASVPDEFLMVRVDVTLITQVILNLVENAVKYGGEEKSVSITVTREEDKASFSVRDYGNGIAEAKMTGLFTGKALHDGDSSHGLGIGLSICRTIVAAHGGQIWAENCADGGACFTFTLPIEEEV